MKRCLSLAAIFALCCMGSSAREPRTWTDLQGRTLEGALVNQDETTIWVRRDNGTRTAIPRKMLSEADQKHLEEVAAAGASLLGERFNTSRLVPAGWKPRPTGLRFGKLVYPATLETEHFIVGGDAKIRPALLASYAEAAERLWTDMATDYPQLVEAFSEKKMPVLLLDGDKQAETFANWHQQHAREGRGVSSSFRLTSYTIVGFSLDKEFAGEAGLTSVGRVFRLDSKNANHSRLTWPERIHFLSEDILRNWIGHPRDNGDFSLSMIRLVFSYHREEAVCGKIESEVSFGGGGSVEGFRNGRNWSGATKKLLAGGMRPDIESFLETPASKAQPRDLGFGLGLMRFIHSDPTRLGGFGKLLEEAAKAEKSPDAGEFAKALGFDSPAELDSAWLDYMLSPAF